jgi:hemerythrin-like domain-containing protein
MECTRELHADFVHIETMLGVLEASSSRMHRQEYVDPEMLRGILRFFQEFVRRCHQLKVEVLLFPLLARRGIAAEVQTIEWLRSQYECSGALLTELSEQIARLPDSDIDLASLISLARRYVDESRRLFLAEHSVLQELLPNALAREEDDALAAELARLERNSIGPTAREWYTQMILDYKDIVSTWSYGPHRALR